MIILSRFVVVCPAAYIDLVALNLFKIYVHAEARAEIAYY